MTSESWNKLELKEQLSNVHGEVVRMIRARNKFLSGASKEDYTATYVGKIRNLLFMTCTDPKNFRRERELIEEENEIQRWIDGEVDDDYIVRYWKQYTDAIS